MPNNDPNLGLAYGWAQGEHNWNGGMDANLKRLGAVVGLSVKDRDLTIPPATPQAGDRYLIPTAATDVWSSRTDQIAVYIDDTWEYHTPKIGWCCFIEDEEVLCVYKTGGWSAGIAI